jgi:hypothetical protein
LGATAPWLIPVWPAVAMSDQFVKGLNAIVPHDDPLEVVA